MLPEFMVTYFIFENLVFGDLVKVFNICVFVVSRARFSSDPKVYNPPTWPNPISERV
jgi:hypothetical protein